MSMATYDYVSVAVSSPGCLFSQPAGTAGRPRASILGGAMESDDDFVVHDEAASRAFTPKLRGKQHKSQDRLMQAIENDELCFICTQPLTDSSPNDLTVQLGMRQVCHKPCYNGYHTLHRVCQTLSGGSAPQAMEELRTLKTTDLPTWRTLCMSLIAAGCDRTSAMRGKARNFIVELVATSRVTRRNRVLLCTKAQYTAWYALNEGMSEKAAASKWQQDLKNPKVHKERKADGTVVVAVELPTEIIADNEIAKRRRLQVSNQGLDQDDFESCFAQLQTKKGLGQMAAPLLPAGANALQPGAASCSTGAREAPAQRPALRRLGAGGGDALFALLEAEAAAHPALALAGPEPLADAGDLQQQPDSLPQQQQEPQDQQHGQGQVPTAQAELAESVKSAGSGGCDGDDGEGDDGATSLTIKGRSVTTMAQFLSFKKQLKEKIKALLKRYDSSQRGKTIVQVLDGLLAQEDIKHDEEVKGLGAETVVNEVTTIYAKLRDMADKKISLWRFQNTKAEQWGEVLDEVDKLVADWGAAVDDVKQSTDIVRDIRIGMQRSQVLRKRQSTYKRSKYATAWNAQGFSQEVAKAFSNCFCQFLETERNSCSEQAVANPGPIAGGEVLDLTKQDAELNVYVAKLAAKVEEMASQQALTLQGQMRSNTIMKPIALPGFEDGKVKELDSLNLVEIVDHAIHKPWLILSASFSCNWGPFRWPCAGLPAIVIALDDVAVVGTILMEKVVSRGLGLANMESWFGDDETKHITDKDIDVVILEKGQAMKLHLGTICLWSFAPASGHVETKAEKAPKGKLLVQWLLSKGPDMSDSPCAAREIKHEWSKLATGYGTSKPWSAIKDTLQAYVDSIKAEK